MFGFGGQRQQRRQRSPDAKLELAAPLEAFYTGSAIPVEVGRQQLCKPCKGTGARRPDDVKTCEHCKGRGIELVMQQIAPGVVQQMQRQCTRCSGKGRTFKESCKTCAGKRVLHGPTKLSVQLEPGAPNGAALKFPGMSDEHPDADAGDLYIVVRQEEHARFRRNGHDLYTDVTLTLAEALLGFSKDLKHLDGHMVRLAHRNQVIQPDQIETVRDEGMPHHGSPKRHGDLYVQYKVVFPSTLDKEQHGLLAKVLRSGAPKDEL